VFYIFNFNKKLLLQQYMDTFGDIKTLVGTDVNHYTITRYIASGSFGNVFEARHKKTNELVALKVPVKNDTRDGQRALLEEAKIYKRISNESKGVTSMKVIQHKDRKIIVMKLLGPSLESLLHKHKRFTVKSVIRLAISMIGIIKYIHSCGYLHRDIKPDNFVIGHDELSKLYCIDFGLAKKYIKKNGDHIEFSSDRKFCGTARYASIAAHKNQEQARKDDLESIAYLLVYLYKGKLPWQSIKHKDKNERYRLIGEMKNTMTEEEICTNMPKEFLVFLKYVRSMDFEDIPPYSALQKMFERLYESRGYENDRLDWEKAS
jgi:casein kinase 1